MLNNKVDNLSPRSDLSQKRERSKVDQWIVFGYGNYLSDIFDAIHANQGRVREIVNNIQPTEQQLRDLKRRIALLGYHVPVLDLDEFHPQMDERYCCGFLNGRDKLIPHLKKDFKLKLSCLIHPAAHLGSNISYGEGVFIGPVSVIGPNCIIGDFSLINRAASIGHDTVLEEYSTISPGVSIGGMVRIGTNAKVGIGATILNDLTIGKNSIIGAGSVVINDVPESVVVVGSPAKFLRKNV
jgi:sugar O-acyltransferase (sialic acid O-acetyltransferase NeuD family)